MINPRLWQHEKNIQEIFTRFSHILIYYENAIRIFIYLYIYIFLPEEIEFEFKFYNSFTSIIYIFRLIHSIIYVQINLIVIQFSFPSMEQSTRQILLVFIATNSILTPCDP